MHCRTCDPFDPRWDEYVFSRPAATFFHRLKWREILADSFGHEPFYLYAQTNGEIIGILPLFLVKSRLFGKSLISIPLGVYGGPVADTHAAEEMLLQEALKVGAACGARYVEIRGNPHRSLDSALPRVGDVQRWVEKDLYVTFIGAIDADDGVNFTRVPRKRRNKIRLGVKNGLRAVIDNNRLPEFYHVYARSVRNLGTPVWSYSYFERLVTQFREHCKVLLVEHGNRVVAAAMAFFHKTQLLAYYCGGLREFFPLAINDFMYWELMSFGATNGFQIFDFGRSKRATGSYDFKQHWGFEPRRLSYWCYPLNGQALPDTSSLNPRLQWAIQIWRHLPHRLTIGIGPHIARHIP
jgi:FemAB-related protein (PEP-CTERM system-associated)